MDDYFGQILLQGVDVAVLMALRETPDLEGTGFVLGTASSDYDPTVVREIELHVDRTVWDDVEHRTELRDLPLPIESHRVHDEDHGELQLSIYQWRVKSIFNDSREGCPLSRGAKHGAAADEGALRY
jgi:hypothetical protein